MVSVHGNIRQRNCRGPTPADALLRHAYTLPTMIRIPAFSVVGSNGFRSRPRSCESRHTGTKNHVSVANKLAVYHEVNKSEPTCDYLDKTKLHPVSSLHSDSDVGCLFVGQQRFTNTE